MSYTEVKARAEAAGQGHIFQFYDDLSADEQRELVESAEKIEFDSVNTYFQRVLPSLGASKEADVPAKADRSLKPLSKQMTSRSFSDIKEAMNERQKWLKSGLTAIGQGEVAVVLLAGGQGTRLGSANPKGMFDVELPSGKSLFQLQGERILKAQRLGNEHEGTNAQIMWYVMTSAPTHDATVNFFEKNKFFGLEREQVVFFQQNTLPCLTLEGKIILEKPSKVATAPDGNGGLYRGLVTGGVLDDMKARGTKHIHAYCVDNVLVKPADPYFIGFSIERNADTAAKVVPKSAPQEKVGVLCQTADGFKIVEYSEIETRLTELRNKDGDLLFDAGNIANHYFTMDFLEDVCTKHRETLTHHIALKKIPTIDEKKEATKLDGMKLELFIFDIFQFSERLAVYYVNREDEFSPLKNAAGAADGTSKHCREDLLSLHARWLKRAGARLEEGAEVEVSPLKSYDGEGLASVKGQTFTGTNHLDE
ncbi:hypothetical protein SARC_05168 [Sphaeroforma arctica JP610]|uniref:UDP-N-acetylglucosamine diphosphorylase n=1 Tax=Sphaeroforma arctica JP610 TaxID=667725 RepID=A0A0L0G0F8_9EUKA|nr:hypothetical protein SARC_05168 [Sphaeroforma arctica JP610]KNC82555.1 hypothetical protein SARC_05168 [Sphaeroforma arctica JP610]|eukprot:XP_014156457.1 hypothetical protein SARC_05168 [Sphaeroforma arctica JP610]